MIGVASRAAARLAGTVLAPVGSRARLSILIYHRVQPDTDALFPGEVNAVEFEGQMAALSACFRILPLAEAVAGLARGTLPARPACVTFDDGYADNAEVALPILQRLGIPATFFVSTGFLDGGRMWNDTVIEAIRAAPIGELDLTSLELGRHLVTDTASRRAVIDALLGRLKYVEPLQRSERVQALAEIVGRPLPDGLMMRSEQVRTLHAAGMEIGGHTVNHPILCSLDARRARAEIADGRDFLAGLVRAPIGLFAYPNGKPSRDYSAEHVAMVRDLGFAAAVSTAHGSARPDADPFQLPRFTPWNKNEQRYLLQLVANLRRNPVGLV